MLLLCLFAILVFFSCMNESGGEGGWLDQPDDYPVNIRRKKKDQAPENNDVQNRDSAPVNPVAKATPLTEEDKKFLENSLPNGTMPYAYCYGINQKCSENDCSQIRVLTPSHSDALVIIKRQGDVVRHAYIKAGNSYTFEVPEGRYQPFFYLGNGWNPGKYMKETDCGILKGGFVSNESYGKDKPQKLRGSVLTYELILQPNGNFSTIPSNLNEVF
jgi:hypothetical protein